MTEKPRNPNFNVTTTVTTSNKNTTNIAEALTQTTSITSTIVVEGFYEKDDIEYGTLQYVASSTLQHDGGIVIDPNAPSPALGLNAYLSYTSTGPGRWIRKLGDRIPIEWFGAKKNDEEFDNILPISKALSSPHVKNRELFFSKGFYVIKSTLTVGVGNITLAGSGKYDTFIVGYKSGIVSGAISPLIQVLPGSDSTIIKDLGLKPWNYPSRHETGWTDRFRYASEGRIRYNSDVKTIDRNINSNDPDFFELDLTDSATQQLFPAHWYITSPVTKTMLIGGGLIPSNPNLFKTFYRTITIAPGQTADIVDTFTMSGIPTGFNLEKWRMAIRIVQTSSSQKGGSTIPSNNNTAMLPSGGSVYGTPAVGIKANAKPVYNYDGTFTVTFKFVEPVSSDFSGLASSNMSGPNYIMPYAIDLERMLVDLELNNVFIDGMWYAGPPTLNSGVGVTNRIGTDDMLTLFSVKNIKIFNCNFENYCNDAISMKAVFDGWGPSLEINSANNDIIVKNTYFRRGGKSGMDIEGSNISLEDCKLYDIMNLGALRYGARSHGVMQENYLFKNCECYLDPKGESGTATSIQRYFGASSVKRVVYENCTFSAAPYLTTIPPIIGILIAADSTEHMVVKNCTFNGIQKVVQGNGKINNITISDCRSINNVNNNGCILYASGSSSHTGMVNIRNHSFERNDSYTNKILDGNTSTTVVDKNQLVRCEIVLSKTDTLPCNVISYSMFRTFFNSMNSIANSIIEHSAVNNTWNVTFALGSNLSNFSVNSSSQAYRYSGKIIEVYLKVTGDVAATGNNTFTFSLPVSVASGVTNLYGTCQFISSGNSPAVGVVIYDSTSVGRVRINPTGTGTSTFWIRCEYEF